MNEQKKIVLLQKEETVENDGILFRVIASGDPEEGFEYAIEGPDGQMFAGSPGFLSLDGALESGIAAAKRVDPKWYRELREAEGDKTLLEEGTLLSELIEPEFDDDNYTPEGLLIITRFKLTDEYVRVGLLGDWLAEKEDALHVSPEWEAIKGSLDLCRKAYENLRAATGSIDIGLEFFKENK